MRRDGEQYIQTLKSRGQSVAGLSERNEWDWYLEKNKLDLKKLDDKCWPAALKDLDKKQLKPIFSTDFVRQRAEIAWGRGKARVVVEAALDLGRWSPATTRRKSANWSWNCARAMPPRCWSWPRNWPPTCR